MTIPEIFEKLVYMDQLIRSETTGPPEAFARRLNISTRSLYNYLSVMKHLGAPIRYSRSNFTYTYTCEGRLILSFGERTNQAA